MNRSAAEIVAYAGARGRQLKRGPCGVPWRPLWFLLIGFVRRATRRANARSSTIANRQEGDVCDASGSEVSWKRFRLYCR